MVSRQLPCQHPLGQWCCSCSPTWQPQFPPCSLGGGRQISRGLGLLGSESMNGHFSPSLNVVSKFRLFRSTHFVCSYSHSCRLQWSHSAVFSLNSFKTEKRGISSHTSDYWVRVFLEYVNLTQNMGQRVVPPEVQPPRPAARDSSAPAVPPTGWGHLQGETSQAVCCVSLQLSRERGLSQEPANRRQ